MLTKLALWKIHVTLSLACYNLFRKTLCLPQDPMQVPGRVHVSTCVSNHCSVPGTVLGASQVPDPQPGGPPSQPVPIVGFASPLF